MVQEYDAYRPLYATTPVQIPRKCIFFGTTNVQELPITDDGSRRIQIIPVEECDTITQATIPMVRVFRELLHEFESLPKDEQYTLWTLTKDEISQTNTINSDRRKADQDADTYLKETYNFTTDFNLSSFLGKQKKFDRTTAITMAQVIGRIRDKMGVTLAPKQLKHALKRQCGQWTGTYSKSLIVGGTTIDKGCAQVIDSAGKVKFSGWLLPPEVGSFASEEENLD